MPFALLRRFGWAEVAGWGGAAAAGEELEELAEDAFGHADDEQASIRP